MNKVNLQPRTKVQNQVDDDADSLVSTSSTASVQRGMIFRDGSLRGDDSFSFLFLFVQFKFLIQPYQVPYLNLPTLP